MVPSVVLHLLRQTPPACAGNLALALREVVLQHAAVPL